MLVAAAAVVVVAVGVGGCADTTSPSEQRALQSEIDAVAEFIESRPEFEARFNGDVIDTCTPDRDVGFHAWIAPDPALVKVLVDWLTERGYTVDYPTSSPWSEAPMEFNAGLDTGSNELWVVSVAPIPEEHAADHPAPGSRAIVARPRDRLCPTS